MRRISIAFALSTWLLVSISSAQQTATGKPANMPKSGVGIDTVVNCANAKTNYIPVFTSAAPPNITICNSTIYQANGNIGIGTTTPAAALDVNGDINALTYLGFDGISKYVPVLDATGFSFFDTFVGVNAGPGGAYEANNSTFVGYGAGNNSNNTGGYNTFVGQSTGLRNTTGSYNLFLSGGYFGAGDNNTTGSSNIYIANEGASSGTENNAIRIGTQGTGNGQQNKAFIAGIYGSTVANTNPVCVLSTGQLGVCNGSSLRFKDQVADMGDSSSKLFQLRPVSFFYKPQYDDGTHALQYGLIAEEVAKVYPEMAVYDKDGQPSAVKYQLLAPMLLNELQKEHAVVMAQQEEMRTQLQQITSQRQEIDGLKRQLQQQNASLQERLSKLESYVATQMKTASDNPPRTTPGANGGLQ